MARVLYRRTWFEQVEPSTYSETQFEGDISLHAESVYPEYYVYPFKLTIESANGNHKPDLVFISRDYSCWLIVEVELGSHSLNHVEAQVKCFAEGKYNDRTVEYLIEKDSQDQHLDKEKLRKLVENEPPIVLVIVNLAKPDWNIVFEQYGAIVSVWELFESGSNERIFRIDGKYPVIETEPLASCLAKRNVNVLQVSDSSVIRADRGQVIRLRYNDCITKWNVINEDDETPITFLRPAAQNPLRDSQQDYVIMRLRDESLILRPKSN